MTQEPFKTIRGIFKNVIYLYVWFCDFLRHNRKSIGYVTQEQTLLERAKRYDEAALGELYDRYAARIYAYIYRRVSDAQLAEDLTGEVFVRVIQAIRSERFWKTSFQAWLYRIAHNLVVDHYRRQPELPELMLDERLLAAEDDPVNAVAQQLSRHQLDAAIRRLTPDQQQVVVLRFAEGLTAREVAEIMSKSVGAVEALQHRALATLRRVLKRE
jgi:RNA polymerase sigma-70 factor (ECF subfamily)